MLRIRFSAANSRGSGEIVKVGAAHRIPEMLLGDHEGFAKWLQRMIFDLERHESQEWLRRDGDIYDDPHKENR